MNKDMKVEWLGVERLRAYENNPRRNEEAIEPVARSIHDFGFRNPILIDASGTIIAGHTRLEAAKQLGLKEVPVIRIEDLTEDQVRAFRLVDNKVAEIAEWDPWALSLELETIDMDLSAFDFDIDISSPLGPENSSGGASWFDTRERFDDSRQDGNDEYNAFLDKFEQPKTTDDCYTPDNVYEAVASWVTKEYGIRREDMVRPFYPGGDYEHEAYPAGCCVVDNPPFSILSKIVDFYIEKRIPFFLFAPGLTSLSTARKEGVCYISCYAAVLYENKAEVRTGFLTSLEGPVTLARVAFELSDAINEANAVNRGKLATHLPKYEYPDNIITAAMLQGLCAHHTDIRIRRDEAFFLRALDSQKDAGAAIYGGGFLTSTRAAQEIHEAKTAAAERPVYEGPSAEEVNGSVKRTWPLSDRERAIIAALDAGEVPANE